MYERTLRAAFLSCVIVLAACAASAQARVEATDAGTTHTLVVDTSFGLQTLDPTFGQTLTRLVAHARWDTLLTYEGGSLTPKPLLATGWKASSQNKVFTFTLRTNARFADGTPLTSADVLFSYKRGQALKGDAASLLANLTVTAPSKYKIVLTSTVPNAAVPAIVTSPTLAIINSKVAKQHGASDDSAVKDTAGQWLSSPASQGAGSGPFTLVEYDTNSQIILGRNLKYWGKRPVFDKVVIRNVPTQTQALDVQRGTYEVALDLGAQDVAPLLGNKNLLIHQSTSPQTFLFFSNNDPAVSSVSPNKHLQQAIRYAIDYNAIRALAGGGALQPGGVLPASFPGALPAKDATKQNVAVAKRELAASGIKSPRITIEYPSDRTINGLPFGSVAQKIQANLQSVGIDVELAGEPVVTVLGRYLSGKIPWGVVPNLPTVDDPTETLRFLPGGFLGKLAGWKDGADPTVTNMADKAQLATGKKRLALWQQVQRLQNARGPWVPLVNPTQYVVSTKDVGGIVYHPQWSVDFRQLKAVKT